VILFTVLLSVNSFGSSKKILHEKTFKVQAGELLLVKAQGGDIGVKAWDKDEVYIKVVGTEKAGKKIKFTFKKTEDGVVVEAKKKGNNWFNWGSGINYRILIRTPVDFNVNLQTSGGDVKLIGLTGNHSVKTSGGDILAKDVKGEVSLTTSGGDIKTENCETDISASTSGGDIEINDNTGNVSVATSGGDIDLAVSNGKVSASTSGGDIVISYSGENKGIHAGTSGGDIKVTLPRDIKADALFKTSGGEVEVEFPNATVDVVKSYKYEGKLNGGGEKIICKTSGGDIIVNSK